VRLGRRIPGTGAVWALGLSSSAAMMMATKDRFPCTVRDHGLIPLSQTLFLWQSMVTAVVLIVISSPSPTGPRLRR